MADALLAFGSTQQLRRLLPRVSYPITRLKNSSTASSRTAPRAKCLHDEPTCNTIGPDRTLARTLTIVRLRERTARANGRNGCIAAVHGTPLSSAKSAQKSDVSADQYECSKFRAFRRAQSKLSYFALEAIFHLIDPSNNLVIAPA
jgi:hypothetical protein